MASPDLVQVELLHLVADLTQNDRSISSNLTGESQVI
jgi:hypothetical protein